MPPSFELGCHSEYGQLDAVVVGRTDGLRYPAFNRNIRYLSGEIAELLSSAPPGTSVDVRQHAPAPVGAAHRGGGASGGHLHPARCHGSAPAAVRA
jgi:hypothetical protein